MLAETQIAVSIGGGASRLVAKLASRRAKPGGGTATQGVHVVRAGDEAQFLSEHDLAAIPGIGPRFQERLHLRGLRTVRDALQHDEATLVSHLGEGTGRWLYKRIRGEDATPVTARAASRSLSHEHTFATDIDDDQDLDRLLRALVGQVCADLRAKGLLARTVTVKLRDADFTTRQAGRTLPEPVSSDRPIARAARALLSRLRLARRTPARLMGVALSQLTAAGMDQLSLFDPGSETGLETRRDRALSEAVDTINRAFGRRRILRGSELPTSS